MNVKQHALAAEIRAEMAAQRISQREMQSRAGIKPASFRNWFVTAKNPVPFPDVVAVCDVLGVAVSEMAHRAEVRAASATQAMRSDLSPEAAAQVAAAEEHIRGRRVSGTGSAKRSKTG